MAAPDDVPRWRRALGIGAVVALPLAVWLSLPAETPRFDKPNFLEAIFANRTTITAARVAVLMGSLYLVVSVVALISRGQWLSSVGPFKVSESVQTLERDHESLARELNDAVETIELLDGLLVDTERELDQAYQELARVRGGEEAGDER